MNVEGLALNVEGLALNVEGLALNVEGFALKVRCLASNDEGIAFELEGDAFVVFDESTVGRGFFQFGPEWRLEWCGGGDDVWDGGFVVVVCGTEAYMEPRD